MAGSFGLVDTALRSMFSPGSQSNFWIDDSRLISEMVKAAFAEGCLTLVFCMSWEHTFREWCHQWRRPFGVGDLTLVFWSSVVKALWGRVLDTRLLVICGEGPLG